MPRVLRSKAKHRHFFVDQGDWAVFHLAGAVALRHDRALEAGGQSERRVERTEAASRDELAGVLRREGEGRELRLGGAVEEARRDRAGEPVGAAVEDAEARHPSCRRHVEVHAQRAAEVLVPGGAGRDVVGDEGLLRGEGAGQEEDP